MDWSLFIFIAIVLLLGYRGYRNGLFKSLARISSIVAGYACAFVYSGQFSSIVETRLGIQGIAAFAVASLILFAGAAVLVGLLFRLIAKFAVNRESISTGSAVGGAAVGALTGLLIAVLAVWAFALVRGLQSVADIETALPVEPTGIENLAGKVAGKAVDTAMSMGSANPEITRISAALFEAPVEILLQARRLSRSEDLLNLLTRPENQKVLNSGDYEAVKKLADFQKLARNPDMQAFMESTRLLENAVRQDQNLEDALAIQLTDVWLRTQRVKNDRRVREIIDDPEFRKTMQSGNPVALLTDRQLLELADIIFSDEAAPEQNPRQPSDDDEMPAQTPAKPPKEEKIFQWTDENGRVHYSDVEPGS